jgi:hypothetical protein
MENSMKVSTEMMKEIAEELRGTCGTLDAKLEERGLSEDDIPQTLLQDLDMDVMCCETCGWWCEPSEMDSEGVCDDCANE